MTVARKIHLAWRTSWRAKDGLFYSLHVYIHTYVPFIYFHSCAFRNKVFLLEREERDRNILSLLLRSLTAIDKSITTMIIIIMNDDSIIWLLIHSSIDRSVDASFVSLVFVFKYFLLKSSFRHTYNLHRANVSLNLCTTQHVRKFHSSNN